MSDDSEHRVERLRLTDLRFDPDNPRFGNLSSGSSESAILDNIVLRFGVDDVLSSLAVNGYMGTEPLVGLRQSDGSVRILEGNRRLAALLILTGDTRANRHRKLQAEYPLANDAVIDPVPVVVYDERTEPAKLLPYLGVRHIVGSKPWDSYAKAAWVANVLETNDKLELSGIERMTGDRRGTIARLLEGYYLVRQLVAAKKFEPSDTIHKGRGTAVGFPFSWVYNALGYSAVQKWVGMEGVEIAPDPIPRDKLDQAAELLVFLFGKASTETQPAIRESRQLAMLATCLDDPVKIAKLRTGTSAEEAEWKGLDATDRALQSFARVMSALDEAQSAVSEMTTDQASSVEAEAKRVRMKAKAVFDLTRQKSDDDE